MRDAIHQVRLTLETGEVVLFKRFISVVSLSAEDEEPCALSESEGDSDKARSNRRRKSSCLVGREAFLIPTMLVLEKFENSKFTKEKVGQLL